MHYTVVRESAGRLRLRLHAGSLDAGEARGIEACLCEVAGVHAAEVHPANQSVLLRLSPAAREEALARVAALDVLHLPVREVPQDDVELPVRLEDERFALEADELMVWAALRRMVLLMSVRAAWAILKSLGYVAKGLACLMRGQLAVEVLDATAITACLLRGTYGEADTIMFLLRLSDVMQDHVSRRTRLALEQGLVVQAGTAWLVGEGSDVEVSLDQVRVGDVLRVRAGATVPVGGEVIRGDAALNEATMTGEAALAHKQAGSTVCSGTAVEEGELEVRVTAPPGQARIDAIAQMVERASELKSSSQGRAERLADGLVPVAFASFLGILAVTRNIEKALAVLMVDYSCAIRISTPILVMSAMREAAARDVVVKGGKYLEALAEADTVVFDKTGTLTEASPRLATVLSAGTMDESQVLRLAACIEEHYPHSVARAIVEGARQRGLSHEHELHAEVSYVVAHGIAARVGGGKAVIGSAHFVFEDEDVTCPEGFFERVEAASPGTSRVYLACGGELQGALCIEDPLRPGVRGTLERLRSLGLSNLVMLTGDSAHAAQVAAREAGVDRYFAQVLPEDKATYVERLEAEGHRVVMVGDGINDSPALAAASVSVALADASDIAQTVADISIRDASLERLVLARDLSGRLQRRIVSRYRFIVGFNSLLIVLGVIGILPLTTAATLHNLSTVAIAASNTSSLLPDRRRLTA